MQLSISDKKLRAVLKKNFAVQEIDWALIESFRHWLQIWTVELNSQEKKGELLETWLFDMGRQFFQLKDFLGRKVG